MADTTRATTDAKIRCFLRAAFRRGWIKEALVLKVTTVKAVYEQKEPYTDEEIEAILDRPSARWRNARLREAAETFRLLLELMLETGLRVGDAVSFDPRVLTKGDSLWIYTFAPQKEAHRKAQLLEAYLTDELKTRIDECEWLSMKDRSGTAREAIRRRWHRQSTSECSLLAPVRGSRTAGRTGCATHSQ